jgi:threonine/homoserine/homoserine lactone efflux protein
MLKTAMTGLRLPMALFADHFPSSFSVRMVSTTIIITPCLQGRSIFALRLIARLCAAEPVADLFSFAAEVVAVSASGVLAPGPLFVANMLYGTRQGAQSGIRVAHGHAVIEIVVIAIIAAGFFSASAFISEHSNAISIVGGAAMLAFAGLQIFTIVKKKEQAFSASKKGPFAAGAALTALNPFFLAWWFTAGLKLVSDSAAFGPVTGVALLFGLHVWMDYAWLVLTAYLASQGTAILKSKYYRLLMVGLAAVLAYYGLQFMASGL